MSLDYCHFLRQICQVARYNLPSLELEITYFKCVTLELFEVQAVQTNAAMCIAVTDKE